MTKREVVSSDVAPRTGLPYSQAIKVGDLVFVAGQVALDPVTSKPVGGDIAVQTRRVLDNIALILDAAGTSLSYAVENLCFLADARRDFEAFNAVYREYFPSDGPARTTVQATLPREGLLVEIRCVAVLPPG